MESDDYDKELISAPNTLRELVEKYKQRKLTFDKQHETLDNEEEDNNFIGTSIPFFHNIIRQEHILPISLESDDFDKELLSAPKTLRELVEKYKERKLTFDKQHKTLDNEEEDNNFIGTSIFDHLAFTIFIFVMAVISVIVMFIVIKLIFKGEKM